MNYVKYSIASILLVLAVQAPVCAMQNNNNINNKQSDNNDKKRTIEQTGGVPSSEPKKFKKESCHEASCSDTCPICMDNLFIKLPCCRNPIHRGCLCQALKVGMSCPLCRAPLSLIDINVEQFLLDVADTNLKDDEFAQLLNKNFQKKEHLNFIMNNQKIKDRFEKTPLPFLKITLLSGNLIFYRSILDNNPKAFSGLNPQDVQDFLLKAAKDNNIEVVKELLDDKRITCLDEMAWGNALIMAAEKNHLDIINLIIQKNITTEKKWFAFASLEAEIEGNIDAAKFLAEQVKTENTWGNALIMAAENNCLDIINLIIQKKIITGKQWFAFASLCAELANKAEAAKFLAKQVKTEDEWMNALICAGINNNGLDVINLIIKKNIIQNGPWFAIASLCAELANKAEAAKLLADQVKTEDDWGGALIIAGINNSFDTINSSDVINLIIKKNKITGKKWFALASLCAELANMAEAAKLLADQVKTQEDWNLVLEEISQKERLAYIKLLLNKTTITFSQETITQCINATKNDEIKKLLTEYLKSHNGKNEKK